MARPQLLLLPLLLLGCCQASKADGLRAKRGAPDFRLGNFDAKSPIPYIMDSRYNEIHKKAIRDALQTFTDNTCLDFKEDNVDGVKLEYTLDNTRQGCAASVGNTNYPWSIQLYLPDGCYHTVALQHETMHALGFRHTQTRHDRDKYVVVADGVKETSNYKKLDVGPNTTDYGIPYEFNSLLHYSTSDDLKAIDPDYSKTLQGSFMIFNDWKLINMHYKCIEKCANKIVCENGGYQHPRQCSKCVCPRFHKGDRCQEENDVVALTPGQSKQLDYGWTYDAALYDNSELARNVEQYPHSPARIIKAPKGSRIRVDIININDFEGNWYVPYSCNQKALEIVDGGDLTRVGKRFCHKTNNGYSFVSETNVLGYLVFARPGLNFVANVTFTVVP